MNRDDNGHCAYSAHERGRIDMAAVYFYDYVIVVAWPLDVPLA
jgi:hypothetical protein